MPAQITLDPYPLYLAAVLGKLWTRWRSDKPAERAAVVGGLLIALLAMPEFDLPTLEWVGMCAVPLGLFPIPNPAAQDDGKLKLVKLRTRPLPAAHRCILWNTSKLWGKSPKEAAMTRSKLSTKMLLLVGGIGLSIAAFAGQPAAAQEYTCPDGTVADTPYGCTDYSPYAYDYDYGYQPYGGYGFYRGDHGFAHGMGGGFNHGVGFAHGGGFHGGGFGGGGHR